MSFERRNDPASIPAGPLAENARRRIIHELINVQDDSATLEGIEIRPGTENICRWNASIPGPSLSVYEGGVYELSILFPPDYPFSPPRLSFLTKVYHCNISDQGAISVDILRDMWSPALTIQKLVLSVSSLLMDPNPEDPLVPEIAQLYLHDRTKHDENAREWTRLYATPSPGPSATV